MKSAFAFMTTLALAAAAALPARAAEGCTTVEVRNVRPQQGYLMVAAYLDAEAFEKKAAAAQLRLPAGEATMSLQLCGLAGPQVALTLFQDLDGDGKMARNLVGMPTEPWGASGSPGAFGPSWETGKVALDGSTIVVTLTQ
jgi:uncharacterized protein (DUF2141 family)